MTNVRLGFKKMEVDTNLAEEFKDLNKDDDEFKKKCARLVNDITSNQLTIVQLVEQLGALLVDVHPPNRELGTWILTHVLQGLPPQHFDVKQLEFICNFYTDRLKDHHQVIPAVLAGILSLTKFSNFPDGAATKILSAVFQNVPCQQEQERDRYNIYKILEALLEKRTTELCTMGLDYVYGVISAVDGERNPKNLILLFNWFPTFVKTVNLGHLTEEAFEILACYFPVDFKAPTQESNAITRDQLADALAPCLTAIPQFAEFCFPLALEKLESSVEIAKLDSLKLLEKGCHSFNTASYIQHSTEIWSQIQKELFNNPTPNIEGACLSTLVSVIKKISQDPSIHATIKDIVDTVKRNLLPDSKLYEPSSKLLLGVASGSEISAEIVTQEVVPILVNTYNITSAKSQKCQLLSTIVSFFSLHTDIKFEELKKVPYLCLKGVLDDNNDLRCVGFDSCAQISKFLPSDVRQSLYEHLRTLLTIPQSGGVKKSVFRCFEALARCYPEEVKEEICTIQISNEQLLTGYLEALCVIAAHDFFSVTVVDIFLGYLKRDLSFSQVVVTTLKTLVEKNEKIHSVLVGKDIVDVLVDFSVGNADTLEAKYLECVAFVLKSVIRNLSVDEQHNIVVRQLPKVGLLKSKRVFVLYGVLCCLRREVEIDYGLLNEITGLLLKEDDPRTKETAAQLVANLVNKCSDKVIQSYLSQFSLSSITDVTLLSWVTKALVMRNHEMANEWTNHLLALLERDKDVAVGFRVVMNDSFDCLSTKSFCVRTLLYQQKFFTYVTNKLNENYAPERSSYLLALGYLLEHAPKQVILLQFKKILKLIVLCLDECDDSEVIIVILQTIKEFIINKETCIEEQFSDFLIRFLNLSTFDKSMNVRILALQCLQECTFTIPVYKLLMHKQDVVATLGKVVDDKKRVVRREAVEARSLWFLIDAPM